MKFLQTSRRAPGRPPIKLVFWWTGVRGLVKLVLQLLYRLKCEGSENVPATGPIIYVSNHQSHLDPMIVGVPIHDRPFSAMARDTLFKSKMFSWVMHGIGAIEIERGKGDTAAMKKAIEELAAGRCVMIFPEGTRSRDGALGEFQRGVMLLIKRSGGAHVVPIAVEGAFDIWPITQKKPRLHGRLAVKVAPAISAEELLKDGPDAGLDRLKRTIETIRLELRQQMRRSSGGRYPAAGPGDVAYWETAPEVSGPKLA